MRFLGHVLWNRWSGKLGFVRENRRENKQGEGGWCYGRVVWTDTSVRDRCSNRLPYRIWTHPWSSILALDLRSHLSSCSVACNFIKYCGRPSMLLKPAFHGHVSINDANTPIKMPNALQIFIVMNPRGQIRAHTNTKNYMIFSWCRNINIVKYEHSGSAMFSNNIVECLSLAMFLHFQKRSWLLICACTQDHHPFKSAVEFRYWMVLFVGLWFRGIFWSEGITEDLHRGPF